MGDLVGKLVEADEFVEGGVGHDFGDKGDVHGVSGALGDDVTEEGLADEGEVADQVEGFVAAALVGEAKSAGVEDGSVIEADRAVERCAADESHVAHLVELVFEAEGAGGGDVACVDFGGNFKLELLAANEGVVEEDVAGEDEAVGGEDGDSFSVAFDGDRAADVEVAAAAAVSADAGVEDHVDEGLSAAVEDGDFEVVDFDEDVVDPHAIEGTEKVFGGGD